MRIVDDLVDMIRKTYPGVEPKYNKIYIGLTLGGAVKNFVTFITRSKSPWVITRFKIQQNDDTNDKLEKSGLNVMPYDSTFGMYKVRVRQSDLDERGDILHQLIREAYDALS